MNQCPIVAIASSAGDLEPVSELLAALPEKCDAAFLIVQHFDERRHRLLVEAFAKRTILPVLQAHDDGVPEPGHVYVMPANTTLTIIGGRIRVTPNASVHRHPGDILFASLAEERGDGAIGVVLSGGGSDGALGISAIRQHGGTTFAQYPGSSRFPSMPISAIETGCVSFVLRPNEIARELIRLSRGAVSAGVPHHVRDRVDKAEPDDALALSVTRAQYIGLDRHSPRVS
jgi:two-component system CheB/CheR fusion protein